MELTRDQRSGCVTITALPSEAYDEILTPDALAFVGKLHERFNHKRKMLLKARKLRQDQIDAGNLPDFLPETRSIRESEWSIAPVPEDIQDRRVEITGPAGDAKMVINAFNSGARVFMADYEDANSPTWDNTISGQIYMRDAIRRELQYVSPEGKVYNLGQKIATLFVRPRGWHLDEKHALVDGEPVSGSLFDFGLFVYHNAHELMERNSGPYFYLPKLENHLEARLWNEVFIFAQEELGIPQGTIKATVLIETILAAFEADEILFELRDHSAGLNCGRWDYIFSYVKKLKNHPSVILPDRAQVTMTVPFMQAYTSYVIRTCHRRNAHAMGGMAAQIPIKNDPIANEAAMNKVKADKVREADAGHDGTWVAHPGLVAIAMEAFDARMPTSNQINTIKREDVNVCATDLLAVPAGTITESGLRLNISVALQYIEAWLRGSGAVPIYNLMEDAATAEISRTQVWQWIRHPKGVLEDGTKITTLLVLKMIEEEMDTILQLKGIEAFEQGKFDEARSLFTALIESDDFAEFLTISAYERLD
ncbi:malate synthase A [Paenibacillus albiflavus]|uniref:Malate synthase n=1 Tax=Paenibacillus albiflavus TaxID=2545760 RepID=A0A4V2WMA9_9BACL|nr:malate synthase A [Paenibacillus albiflavus]TCZ67503.1 malate synthase A [Paenibacillus albiflavus]